MTTAILRPARLPELRQRLKEALNPSKLVIVRRGDGLVHLRVLSESFEGIEDPLVEVERALAAHGLRLPNDTLLHLRAPSEVEGDDDELALFEPPPVETPSWAAALELECDEATRDDRELGQAKVVAFWGLKGGVGRTTSLAHVATYFGNLGRRVLAVDLDLDSPGLLAVLAQPRPDNGANVDLPRFDQLVIDAQDASIDDDTLRRRVDEALRRGRDELPRVDLLGPEIVDERFIRSLLGPLRPDRLYRGPRLALRRLLRLAVEATGAQLILVDARSGYCEESAVALLDLADQVVIFGSPTTGTFRSFAPAFSALERRYRGAARPTVLHVVAGMLPSGNEARDRILRELNNAYLLARQDIYDTLGGVELLPADLSIIPISYAGVVVENMGGLGMSLDGVGYRELCERLDVTLWPPIIAQPQQAMDAVQTIFKEIQLPEAVAEDEGDLGTLLELFTRTPDHESFLRPSRSLVLGAKGMGKTYLRRVCLEDPKRLNAPHGMRFVDAFSMPRGVLQLGSSLSAAIMIELDKQADRVGWQNLWSAIALHQVLAGQEDFTPAISLPAIHRARAARSSEDRVKALLEAAQTPLLLEDMWVNLDQMAHLRGQQLVLLFDDLDVVLGRTPEVSPRRKVMLAGLLDRMMSSWHRRSALSAKVFLRDDLLRGLHLQDLAKIEANALRLTWKEVDIWRMLLRAVAVGSETFNQKLHEANILDVRLDALPSEQLLPGLDFLWGRRMGATSNNSATKTLSWVQRRLTDGTGRLFPRAALWLLRTGFDKQRARGVPTIPPLLSPSALRESMPVVANLRLEELKNESTEDEWERILRLKGSDSYQTREQLLEHLRERDEPAPEEALKTLADLGIVELANNDTHARIVDLYAFAEELGVSRLGRR